MSRFIYKGDSVNAVPGFANAIKYNNSSSDLEADNVQLAIDELAKKSSNFNPYNYIKQYEDYLFEVQYSTENIDLDKANEFYKNMDNDSSNKTFGFGCTAVYKNGHVLRHMDWLFDNCVTFIIRRPADTVNNIHASIGTAGCMDILSKDIVESGKYNIGFEVLPYATYDGINDAGIYTQLNVVPRAGVTVNINPYAGIECAVPLLPRYILDHLSSIDDLSSLLDTLHIYTNDSGDYGLHLFVADKNTSKVVEFNNNSYDIIDSPIMTNFRLNNGFQFDRDTYRVENWNSVEPYGEGVERWNIAADYIRNNINNDLEPLRDLLKYSNAYTILEDTESNPVWFTEFTGNFPTVGDLTVQKAKAQHDDKSLTTFNTVLSIVREQYASRERGDGNGWQTVWSSIYDINKKTISVKIQERFDKSFNFSLDENTTIDELDTRIKNNTEDIININQTLYNQEEIINELESKVRNIGMPNLDYNNYLHVFSKNKPADLPNNATYGLSYTCTKDCYLLGTIIASGKTTDCLINNRRVYFSVYQADGGISNTCNIVPLTKLNIGDTISVNNESGSLFVFSELNINE